MKLKPFFTYFGGKWRAAPHYPPPRYETIVEPFAGAAGYATRYADRRVVLVEKDPAVAATWRYLLGVQAAEILNLPDLGAGQTTDDLVMIPEEARLLIGWWLNKGAATSCKTPSAWMRSGVRPNSYWGPAIRQRIATQVSRIKHWILVEGSYENVAAGRATWFVDPPYFKAGRNYRHHTIDYAGLAAWCRTRRGQVIVCEAAGATWLPFTPWRTCRASPAKHGGKVSREVIWTYDNPKPFRARTHLEDA